jgi:hypothetical protein
VKRRRFDRSIPFVLLLTLVGVAVLLVSLAHTGTNEAQGLPLPITIPSITLPIPQNPRVASTEPANGASNIPYDPIVSATFDKNMDPTTLSPASFYLKKSDGTPVPATVKYSTDLLGWYLYPQVTLDPGTTYVATLTAAAKGANGLVLWAAPVTWSFTTVSFTDVSLDDPYAVAISHLASATIINGFADHSFRPGDPVTRQQFAKMITRVLGLPVTVNDVCPFGDVASNLDPSDPLYPDHYVAVCAAHGITEGRTPSTFAPYDPISRFALITMVVRAIDNLLPPGVLKTPPANYRSTWDPALSSDHGQNARLAEYNHLLAGIPLASLNPWDPMPRGEVAQVLWNVIMNAD